MSHVIPSVFISASSRVLQTVTLSFSPHESWGDQESHHTIPVPLEYDIFGDLDHTLADEIRFPVFKKLAIDTNGTAEQSDRLRLLGSFPRLGATGRVELLEVEESKLYVLSFVHNSRMLTALQTAVEDFALVELRTVLQSPDSHVYSVTGP